VRHIARTLHQAVEVARAQRNRLTAQIDAMLLDWALAPVVAALQTMRGMGLVNAATLITALCDLALCQSAPTSMADLGPGVLRAGEQRQRHTRRHH